MSERGQLYALLIGINEYQSQAVRKLQFAVADVVGFRQSLEKKLGLSAGNCMVLASPPAGSDPPPRRGDVLRVLTQFAKAPMRAEDTFLLYFAGHGFAAREKSYLLTVDSDPALPELLEETAISLETLNKFARRIHAGQQLWILDACRNEPTTLTRDAASACLGPAMTRDIVTLARDESPPAGEARLRPARAVLSACWEGQVSYEYLSGGHSWFCYNLLACLDEHPPQELEVTQLTEQVRERMRHAAWREFPEASEQEPHVVVEGRPVRLHLRAGESLALPATPSASPVTPSEPRARCPACGRTLRVSERVAGRQLPCPSCGTQIQVSGDGRQLTLAVVAPPELFTTPQAGSLRHGTAVSGLPEEIEVRGIKFRLIPAGRFLMGAPDSDKEARGDEKPQHRVHITKPFYFGVYAVTQSQYEAVIGRNPSRFKGDGNRPVEMVSWKDAVAFCRKLTKALRSDGGGAVFRLPTEAEWEYACRAGTVTRYCFGDDAEGLGEYAWFGQNSGSSTHPVGQKKPNAWGLYDMHGNVWEWCQDWYGAEYYAGCQTEDPCGSSGGSNRVSRGGGWYRDSSNCRASCRGRSDPGDRRAARGFRLLRAVS